MGTTEKRDQAPLGQLRIDEREHSRRRVERLRTLRAGAPVLAGLLQLLLATSQSDEGQRLLADVFAGVQAASARVGL